MLREIFQAGETHLGRIFPIRNRKLQIEVMIQLMMTAHIIVMYVFALLLRRHDRKDWRLALVESNAATAIEAPKKKDATSRPPLVVFPASYQGGTSVPPIIEVQQALRIEDYG
jgi:hypothetical protein